jgi:hypothetical protein
MKIDKSSQIGDAGIALIHTRVSAMGHVWRVLGQDAGIDGQIELRNPASGEVSNRHLLVQSKASDRDFPGESIAKFHFICDDQHVEYWMQSDIPVILVCSHPKSHEAWWVHVQDYFSDPARRAACRVDFDKSSMAFDDDITDRLFAVADPHGRAHTSVPEERPEVLVSNLLPVEIPGAYWSYPTRLTRARDVDLLQRESGLPVREDYILVGGRLLAWVSVEGTALARAVQGVARVDPTGELMFGGQDGERRLVWMLNAALRHDVREDCAWHRKRDMLYFRATPELLPRQVNTSGTNWRTVFKGYPKKTDPAQMSFYRHAGLRSRFMCFDGQWLCALTPDYFFSYDGMKESRFTASLLGKIKRLERNPAVRSETRMWATYLRAEPNLLDQRERLLEFGDLLTFPVELGIDDAAWRKGTDASEAVFGLDSLFEDSA